MFRAAEIDEAELVAKGKALDLEVRRWLASKMNKNLTKSRLTAQVLGVGANAPCFRTLPGCFGGIPG